MVRRDTIFFQTFWVGQYSGLDERCGKVAAGRSCCAAQGWSELISEIQVLDQRWTSLSVTSSTTKFVRHHSCSLHPNINLWNHYTKIIVKSIYVLNTHSFYFKYFPDTRFTKKKFRFCCQNPYHESPEIRETNKNWHIFRYWQCISSRRWAPKFSLKHKPIYLTE